MNGTDHSLLLIDDDLGYATILMQRLQRYGFSSIHAEDASQALLLARRQAPEFIVLDMMLQSSSGLELIAPLRASCPTARIVMLTGYASIATTVTAIKCGADNYLSKPVSTQLLVDALRDQNDRGTPLPTAALSAGRLEWEHIQQVLSRNGGNVSASARELGMHRRTLQRKLQKKPVKQ